MIILYKEKPIKQTALHSCKYAYTFSIVLNLLCLLKIMIAIISHIFDTFFFNWSNFLPELILYVELNPIM